MPWRPRRQNLCQENQQEKSTPEYQQDKWCQPKKTKSVPKIQLTQVIERKRCKEVHEIKIRLWFGEGKENGNIPVDAIVVSSMALIRNSLAIVSNDMALNRSRTALISSSMVLRRNSTALTASSMALMLTSMVFGCFAALLPRSFRSWDKVRRYSGQKVLATAEDRWCGKTRK